MHYQKILLGIVILLGLFAAVLLWRSFSPVSANAIFDGAGDSAAQTWNGLASVVGIGQSKQNEVVIDNNSPDGAEESTTTTTDTVDATTASTTGYGAENAASLPEVDGQSEDSSISASSSTPSTEPSDSLTTTAPIDAVASSSSPTSSCSFSFPSVPPPLSRQVIFNEIAWMGSPGAAAGEWIEIKNISGSDVDLAGWEILNTSGKLKVSFGDGDAIPAGGLMLLARANTAFADGATVQKTYSGDLRNTGDDLALVDASCGVSDFIVASSTGWPAGNNTTKQTMERDAGGVGWHTSLSPGGTPGEENSVPPPPVSYKITVSFDGSGVAVVTSDPGGMTCADECTGSYPSGTKVSLTVTHPTSTTFVGWSGVCYNQTQCVITLKGDVDLTAEIRPTLTSTSTASDAATFSDAVAASSASGIATASATGSATTTDINTSTAASSSTSTNSTTSLSSVNHLLIVAIQIAGATANNDFVKIYDPTGSSVDMSGWKLHKKSSTGVDASVREFPTGTVIAPGQYFVWANSADGFAASIGADTSSTQTLAADNSVALMDGTGAIVDAVAWGTGADQYGEGPPFPTDPGQGQILVRQSIGGVMVDTDNNANDFTLQ